jgi:hypothetical protein
MHKNILLGAALLAAALSTSSAFAVGGGVPFFFREGFVPGGTQPNPVPADSEDFTYHSCVHFVTANSVVQNGYFWVSSYQDAVGVVNSQINFIGNAGYRVYGRYHLAADECIGPQPTCNNLVRRSYAVTEGQIELFIDPSADTVLGLNNCQVVVANTGDDQPLGLAAQVISGQITETNDQANGDFDVLFGMWAFTAAGQQLYRDGNNNALAVNQMEFNANTTRLQGAINADHLPEGSGNFYWVD